MMSSRSLRILASSSSSWRSAPSSVDCNDGLSEAAAAGSGAAFIKNVERNGIVGVDGDGGAG